LFTKGGRYTRAFKKGDDRIWLKVLVGGSIIPRLGKRHVTHTSNIVTDFAKNVLPKAYTSKARSYTTRYR
jgi:hypothetical protein